VLLSRPTPATPASHLHWRADLGDAAGQVTFEPDPYVAAQDAHAIAILTEWPHFAELDYQAIQESMVKPAFIFDGRNLLDHKKLHAMGFNVYAIGKPPLTSFSGDEEKPGS
jgi:UDPglucose 6-dehydrogenase